MSGHWLQRVRFASDVRERAEHKKGRLVQVLGQVRSGDEYVEELARRAGEEALVLTTFKGPTREPYAYLVRAKDGAILYVAATFVELCGGWETT